MLVGERVTTGKSGGVLLYFSTTATYSIGSTALLTPGLPTRWEKLPESKVGHKSFFPVAVLFFLIKADVTGGQGRERAVGSPRVEAGKVSPASRCQDHSRRFEAE
ncbi:hypothetical protein HRR83_004629 [Exophiala dermatitidis]|uniref:Uncharacterized protein n=1 Tax=Exophiala dermatitidis TaxID=5970 RepID=A0AAN6F245_EXODE|nr:hypothetical protein HRR74_004090 [Exophiala dermatitidis]KAJ4529165.1 hypothetical protein HRR73_000185 [Exophiala dermatitidis]KAJ4544190.1 hypothetical protein HRR76_002257 [Exophiala dermatitidis]KAJ4549371.1 hypothetical protein HRR77_004237 [Exophiala dermatitidis]KAJ4575663.1 hypothetical protein HRR79_002569 [Exophiala dermatitidis]